MPALSQIGRPPVFALLAFLFAVEARGAPAEDQDDRKWCRMCHREPAYEALSKSAHAALSCRKCHKGYLLNPHEPVEKAAGDFALVAEFAKSDKRALAACSGCHADVGSPEKLMPHGSADGGLKPPQPYCLDCHGEPHRIQKADSLSDSERRRAQNAACMACHADPKRMATLEKRVEPAETYAESVHARKLALGSRNAPGCVDCHGGHSPGSLKQAPEAVCAKCHPGASPAFASLVSHQPVSRGERPVAFFTQKFFAWLTFLTVLGLVVHVGLDATQWFGRRRGGKHD